MLMIPCAPILQIQSRMLTHPYVSKQKNLLKHAWQIFLFESILFRIVFDCGAGGIRTLVQTSYQIEFYTFSLHLIFDHRLTANCIPET